MEMSPDPPGAERDFDPRNPFVAPSSPARPPGTASPAHRRGPRERRAIRRGVVAGVVFFLLLVAVPVAWVAIAYLHSHESPPLTPAQQAQVRAQHHEENLVTAATALVGVPLPTRPGAAAPALPASGFKHPLASHQVWGFVPYWYLREAAASADLPSLTTVAYFAVGIGPTGTVLQNDSGWVDLGSSTLATLMRRAHAAGDRVLLTVATDSAPVLDALSACPRACAGRLVPTLVHLVRAYGFDGVDIDLEGHNGGDRPGFAQFAAAVADGVHAADPAYEVAIDTYPQSASDPNGFFDIGAIAPHVDAIFVMAYDMYQPGIPSANAPLTGTSISVATALEDYTATVPRSKIVLGVPFYGDDWATSSVTTPGSATGPIALPYQQIAGGHHPVHFDPATDTVFVEYRYRGHSHEAWYDDPLTLALKAALASEYHVAGVGAWAFGMQGQDSGLVPALLGGAPAVKLPLVRAGG